MRWMPALTSLSASDGVTRTECGPHSAGSAQASRACALRAPLLSSTHKLRAKVTGGCDEVQTR